MVIGDHLRDRYDVVHKLVFGTYSTTWLARDRRTKKYVAVKVAVADVDIQESNILDSLSDGNDERHPGKALISQALDRFLLDGPNGTHTCLVTEPGMMSLAEAKDASYCRLFTLPVAKAIATQVIQVVAFLHHRGIVHAGMYFKSMNL
jgi:serine/threonine-protein kinase SRPK3